MIHRVYALLRDQRGMSLAEILVASVVIAIGLVGLLSAVPLASYGIQEGRNLSTATFLANQRLEEVRNVDAKSSGGQAGCLGLRDGSTRGRGRRRDLPG